MASRGAPTADGAALVAAAVQAAVNAGAPRRTVAAVAAATATAVMQDAGAARAPQPRAPRGSTQMEEERPAGGAAAAGAMSDVDLLLALRASRQAARRRKKESRRARRAAARSTEEEGERSAAPRPPDLGAAPGAVSGEPAPSRAASQLTSTIAMNVDGVPAEERMHGAHHVADEHYESMDDAASAMSTESHTGSIMLGLHPPRGEGRAQADSRAAAIPSIPPEPPPASSAMPPPPVPTRPAARMGRGARGARGGRH